VSATPSPLVIYGDTSQDGLWYGGIPDQITLHDFGPKPLPSDAGIVVATAIPRVLAITFVVMKLTGVSLQRISLGALIIGLGLLVDDAMIAVETMVSKLEQGADKVTAATAAYTSTAFPMLTGTPADLSGKLQKNGIEVWDLHPGQTVNW